MQYSRVQLGPIYRIQGTPVTLIVNANTYPPNGAPPLRFLDKTAGLSLPGIIEVETTRPAAVARVSDIVALGLSINDLDQASLNMNGKVWVITSVKPEPSPQGENDGEVYMFLQAA